MSLRVLLCGAWDEGAGYPRTVALRQGLLAAGVEVAECRAPAVGAHKQRLVAAPWRWPAFLLRTLLGRWRLRTALRRALAQERPDVIVVPYPGHHLVGDIARVASVPVVLDLFLSAFDTAVVDRRLFAPTSWPARLLRALDRRACAAADLVLVDTEQNAAFVADLVQLPRAHFAVLPIGDPAGGPALSYAPPEAGRLRVLFFGTGVPLHGLQCLIDACAMVEGVTLELVGGTPGDRAAARARLGPRLELGPEFEAWPLLQRRIERADLVAGVFSAGDKAARVVPYKVVHALAAGRPVVTAATPALRAIAQEGDGVLFVPAGDASALASRLRELVAEPQPLALAAARARSLYERHFASGPAGERLGALLGGVARAGRSP